MYWPLFANESVAGASLWQARAIVTRSCYVKALAACVAVLVMFATEARAATLGRAQNPDHPDWPEAQISPELRRQRAARIRDTAAAVGMTNAVLLAGIGQVETGFAHCWSEATWACQGPASTSCDGGPVIAGAADGPCSAEQGGLGIFQFDAGTFTDTINTYGPEIVTIEGNVEAVVPFLITRAIQSIEGVDNEQEALDWMNSIPIVAGDPRFEEWIYFVSWRYNGCQGCSAQEGKYRDGTLLLLSEMGPDFWSISAEDRCQLITSDSTIIEEDGDCATLGGPLTSWRSEASGHGGGLRWTKTTDDAEAVNYGVWRLRFEREGDYEIFVFTDDGEFGQSTQAAYEVSHAGGADVVIVDQSSAEGWRSLGEFSFGTGEGHQVRIDDNTGEPLVADPGGVRLVFDALRVEAIDVEDDVTDDPVDDEEDDSSSNVLGAFCALSSNGSSGAWPLLFVLFALRRHKRDV